MIAKTLAQLRAAVVNAASIGGATGQGSSFRHDQDVLDQDINSAYQRFLEELSSRDFPYFIEESEQDVLPTERADTNENYSLIDWPTTAHEIKRIDVYANGTWDPPLTEVDWSLMRDVLAGQTRTAQRPLYYAIKRIAKTNSFEGVDGTEYELEAGKIALFPFATGGVYKLSYLPVWTYALDDDELFVFPTEWGFRWCVWEAVSIIAVRDRNAGKRGDQAKVERGICEAKIGRYVSKKVATGGATMRRSKRFNG